MDALRDELCDVKVALGLSSFKLDETINFVRRRDRELLQVRAWATCLAP